MSQVSKQIEEKLEDLITTVNEALTENNKRTHEIDLKLVDVYHFIEFNPNLDAASGYSAYKRLSEILAERREVKDNLTTLQLVQTDLLSKMVMALKTNDLEEANRSYRARTGEYENIPGVNYSNVGAELSSPRVAAKAIQQSLVEAEAVEPVDNVIPKGFEQLYQKCTVIHPGNSDKNKRKIIAVREKDKILYDFASIEEAMAWLKTSIGGMQQAKPETIKKHILKAVTEETKYNTFHWYTV